MLLFVSSLLFAQTSTQPNIADLKRIQEAALQSDYSYRFAAHLTDNIGPRLSGSPQYNQAAQWVADEFRHLGLDVQMEKVMVPHWVRGEETGELVQFPGRAPNSTQKLVLTALGGSVATLKMDSPPTLLSSTTSTNFTRSAAKKFRVRLLS
jgi:hypothetical protein